MKKYLVVFMVSMAMAVSGLYFDASAKADSKKTKKETAAEKADKKKDKADKKKEKKEKEAKADKKKEKEDKEDKADKKKEKKERSGKTVKYQKSADEKELGKDAKGRMIYEGPRGGQYYYTDHGTKVYLKKEDKK